MAYMIYETTEKKVKTKWAYVSSLFHRNNGSQYTRKIYAALGLPMKKTGKFFVKFSPATTKKIFDALYKIYLHVSSKLMNEKKFVREKNGPKPFMIEYTSARNLYLL